MGTRPITFVTVVDLIKKKDAIVLDYDYSKDFSFHLM